MAFLVPDRTSTLNGVPIKEYFLTEHNPNGIDLPTKRTKQLKGITIHNTEAITVNDTTMSEQYTRATVNGNMRSVRVHFYVDNKEAWQNLPLDYTSWHAADGNGDGNTATISIECIMANKGYEQSEDNCARLTAYLLKLYGLTTANVFTHTYWLNVRDKRYTSNQLKDEICTASHPYKTCPAYIIPHWSEFIKKVNSYMNITNIGGGGKMYCVQVGAFRSEENAKKQLAEAKKYFPYAYIKET